MKILLKNIYNGGYELTAAKGLEQWQPLPPMIGIALSSAKGYKSP